MQMRIFTFLQQGKYRSVLELRGIFLILIKYNDTFNIEFDGSFCYVLLRHDRWCMSVSVCMCKYVQRSVDITWIEYRVFCSS